MFCTEYCMNKSVHQGMLPTINIHKFCSLDCCMQLTTNLRNYLEAAVEAWLPVAFLPHPLPSSFFKVDTKGDLSHAGQESSFVGHFPDWSLVAAWHDSQSQVFITTFIRVIMIMSTWQCRSNISINGFYEWQKFGVLPLFVDDLLDHHVFNSFAALYVLPQMRALALLFAP